MVPTNPQNGYPGGLVEATLPLVRRIAKRYRSSALSLEDLVSEGTVGLLEAAQQWQEELGVPFEGFAKRHIRKAIRQACKRFAPTVACADELPELPVSDSPTELLEALEQLPAQQREVLYASYWLSQTLDEIAAEQGVSRSTVKRLKQEGLDKLRKLLGED